MKSSTPRRFKRPCLKQLQDGLAMKTGGQTQGPFRVGFKFLRVLGEDLGYRVSGFVGFVGFG